MRLLNPEFLIYLLTSAFIAPRYKNPRGLWQDRNKIKTILVVHLGHLGEMVLATGALACLRNQFPNTRITLLGGPWATPVMEGSSLIDEILTYGSPTFSRNAETNAPSWPSVSKELGKRHFDVIVDLRKDFSVLRYEAGVPATYLLDNGVARVRRHVEHFGDRGRHFFQRYLDSLQLGGISTDGAAMAMEIPECDRKWAAQKLCEFSLGSRPYAVLHPFATTPERDWPAANFACVADRLQESRNMPVLITGLAHERARADALARLCKTSVINLTGETSLHQLAALFADAELVLSNDGGAAHVAAGVGAKLIVFFAPPIEYWLAAPWSERTIVINATRKLTDISIEDAMQAIDEQLGTAPSGPTKQAGPWPFRLKMINP